MEREQVKNRKNDVLGRKQGKNAATRGHFRLFAEPTPRLKINTDSIHKTIASNQFITTSHDTLFKDLLDLFFLKNWALTITLRMGF